MALGKRTTIHLSLLLIIGLPLAPATAVAVHDNCSDCHTEGKSLKIPEATLLCLSCHSQNRNDHKTGTPPGTMKTPLPIDKEGNISCVTCHDPHGKGSYPRLLKMKKDDLCLNCHDK